MEKLRVVVESGTLAWVAHSLVDYVTGRLGHVLPELNELNRDTLEC